MAGNSLFICLQRAFLGLSLAVFLPGSGMAKPERIVSMNVCADQLLLLLADRQQIVSLSNLATDQQTSMMAEQAAGLPKNHGLSEEILQLEPDLILAGEYTTRPTVFLLRKLGYRVIVLPIATSLNDIRANIKIVAEAVGASERGRALVAEFDNKLSSADMPGNEADAPMAALYWANGFTSGEGTLASSVVKAAGFRNLGSELGIRGTGQVSLETLITSMPDLLILDAQRDKPAMATENLHHPALRKMFADHSRIRIPSNLWVCGTPVIADAIAELHAIKSKIMSYRKVDQK